MKRNLWSLLLTLALALPSGARCETVPKASLANATYLLASDNKLAKTGTQEKYVLYDETRQLWLLKPQVKHMAYLEEAVTRLAVLAGVSTPEAYCVQVDGKFVASLAKIIDVKGNVGAATPESLTPAQQTQLPILFLFDWLVGNYDTHGDNFLIDRENALVPVDFGFAFSPIDFFKYRLDQGDVGREYSYFHAYWGAVKAGKIQVDWQPTQDWLARLAAVPEADLAAALAPLARFRIAGDGCAQKNQFGEAMYKTEEEFVFAFLRRKRNLAADFAGFLAHHGIAHPDLAQGKAPAAAAPKLQSVDPEPLSLKITDDFDSFSKMRRLKNKAAHVWQIAHMTSELRNNAAKWLVSSVRERLRYIMKREFGSGFTIGEVQKLDLETLELDVDFTGRLAVSSPDVIHVFRERAEYLAHHAADDTGRAKAAEFLAHLDGLAAKR